MTGFPRSAAVAAVLVTAAAALLGGCGSHSDATASRSGSSTVTSPATTAGSSGADAASDTTPAPDSTTVGPAVPDAQLTPPGGGTFTTQQKSYLSGRVPKGVDPVAVLEGGQAVCERLTRTAATDKDAAAGAIVFGDIALADARAAADSLCPAMKPVVESAAHGFADGGYSVKAKAEAGRTVAPGRYHSPQPSPKCSWQVTGAGGSPLSRGTGATAARMTVPASATAVVSHGCYTWLPSGGGS